MLVPIETLKEYLGLPTTVDPAIDPTLERSSLLAQALVESYVRFKIELDMSALLTDTRYQLEGVRIVRLRHFPVVVSSVKVDDVLLPAAEYTMDNKLGVLEFVQQRGLVNKLEVKYAMGFDPENFPADIETAIVNMALGIYENGGKITTQVAGGALKSMTMFDAMSMSFDTTGATADSAGTPAGIVSQWAFVLDKYRADSYSMG